MAKFDKWLTFGSCLIHQFLVSGTLKANGVFVESLVERFHTNHTVIAWAFGSQAGIIYMISPISRFLLRWFSYRKLSVLGGILAGFGYIVCALFASDVWQMFVSVVISGIGLGLSDLPHYLALKQHFQQDFPKICTLSSLSHFIGVAVLPPLAQYLKNVYGLQGVLLIMGALVWNSVVGGFAIMRTPTYEGDKRNLGSILDEEDDEKISETEENLSWSEKNLPCLSSMFRHENFPILMVFDTLAFYVYTSWALFLVTLGVTQGLSPNQAALLSTVGGIFGALGRLSAAILFHFNAMNAYTSSVIPVLVNGFSMAVSPMVTNFFLLAGLSALSGFSQGVNQTGVLGLLPATVCNGHFPQAAVLNFSMDGVAMQLGGLLSGAITDFTGSVIYVFWCNAILSLTISPLGILWGYRETPTAKECSFHDY